MLHSSPGRNRRSTVTDSKPHKIAKHAGETVEKADQAGNAITKAAYMAHGGSSFLSVLEQVIPPLAFVVCTFTSLWDLYHTIQSKRHSSNTTQLGKAALAVLGIATAISGVVICFVFTPAILVLAAAIAARVLVKEMLALYETTQFYNQAKSNLLNMIDSVDGLHEELPADFAKNHAIYLKDAETIATLRHYGVYDDIVELSEHLQTLAQERNEQRRSLFYKSVALAGMVCLLIPGAQLAGVALLLASIAFSLFDFGYRKLKSYFTNKRAAATATIEDDIASETDDDAILSDSNTLSAESSRTPSPAPSADSDSLSDSNEHELEHEFRPGAHAPQPSMLAIATRFSIPDDHIPDELETQHTLEALAKNAGDKVVDDDDTADDEAEIVVRPPAAVANPEPAAEQAAQPVLAAAVEHATAARSRSYSEPTPTSRSTLREMIAPSSPKPQSKPIDESASSSPQPSMDNTGEDTEEHESPHM